MLTGEARGFLCWNPSVRRVMRAIPSDPRCKLCDTPFGRPGGILRFVGFGRSRLNRRICSACIHQLEKRPGGAEVEVTLLFADVRKSTALAERTGAEEFSRLMARFYGAAAAAVDAHNGILDKFVGDEAVAFFVPGFSGRDHARAGIEAARALLAETGHGGDDPWIPVGVGVHTGVAFVGTVGQADALDFTALGDPVNTTARLASSAGPGEILVSAAAAAAAALDTGALEARTLDLRGRTETMDAWVIATRAREGRASPAPT